MDNEKNIINDVDNSSAEKVASKHFENNDLETVNLGKDPGGFAIPDPDAHLSPDEKAVVVSFSASIRSLGAQLTLCCRTASSSESWIGL